MNKFTNPKKRQGENIATINEVFFVLFDEFDAQIFIKIKLDGFSNEEYTLQISISQMFTKNDSKLFYSDIIQNKILYLENNNFRAIRKGTWLSRLALHYGADGYVGFMECVYYDDDLVKFTIKFKTI